MSSTGIIEPYNKMIRKRKRRVFGFQKIGSVMGKLKGPFRENIRLFLEEFCDYENYCVLGMPVWCMLLISDSNDIVFPLYVIEEETATYHSSPYPFCSHCKFVGWGHHFVSKRRYHIIIPSDDNWNKPLKGNCIWIPTHLLHGLIHCNGYGHLLVINTLNEDTNSLNGTHLMDLWDRLCTTLQTRKISVNDFSRKKSVELRLLNAVAYGTTWFGKWGYKFGNGSFGVTEDKYERAIRFLSTLKLDKVMNDFKDTVRGRKIEHIVRSYRAVSDTPLVTVGDLLQFILSFSSKVLTKRKPALPILKQHASSRKSYQNSTGQGMDNPISLSTFVSNLTKGDYAKSDCRWPARRIEFTVSVLVDLLNENKASDEAGKDGVMSRHQLRSGARNHIGDTGLIDYVLKSISCIDVGDQVISRSLNPFTKLFEFRIDDIVKDEAGQCGRDLSNMFVSSLDSRWPKQRLEHVAQVIVDILKANKAMGTGNGTMSRQEVRDRARQCIGDTGLIDFVLKSINNCSMIGNQIVSRSKNPSTRLIEFAIREENMVEAHTVAHEPGQDVYGDVLFLYKNVLLGYPEWDSVSLATRAVLDSKHFVKEWAFKEDENSDQVMAITCRVLPSFEELETELTRPLCPGEVVMVPQNMTIGELKVVAQCALRDTYCVMEDFIVTQIGGLKGIDEEWTLSSCAVGPGSEVWVRGNGLDLDTELRYEGGPEDGKLDCVCGARSDDGERMVACDECDVWQHTRCRGIDDDEPVPEYFLCYKCVVQRQQHASA